MESSDSKPRLEIKVLGETVRVISADRGGDSLIIYRGITQRLPTQDLIRISDPGQSVALTRLIGLEPQREAMKTPGDIAWVEGVGVVTSKDSIAAHFKKLTAGSLYVKPEDKEKQES